MKLLQFSFKVIPQVRQVQVRQVQVRQVLLSTKWNSLTFRMTVT